MRNVHVIINPAAGQEEPILTYLNTILQGKVKWDVSITHKAGDAKIFAKEALKKKVDIIAIYGGDGSVMEVSQALYKQPTPLAILPGGTANVLAKDLGIPTITPHAIKLLTKRKLKIKTIDMGLFNTSPFFIRVNFGILADMVKSADRKMKDRLGQVAYGVTAVKHWKDHEQVTYTMVLDGEKVITEGAALVVANSGNIGFSDVSFVPNMSMSDGMLDVVLLRKIDLVSVAKVIGNTLMKKEPENIRRHWQIKEARITVSPKQTIMVDDAVIKDKEIVIKVVPKALQVLVP